MACFCAYSSLGCSSTDCKQNITLNKTKLNTDQAEQIKLKESGCIPKHIAIIMDGNGRWAKSKGLPRFAGHQAGVESVREIVRTCVQLGVKNLTLYTFSTENWKRPKDEVSTLMRLLVKTLQKELDDLHKNNVRIMMIGDMAALPIDVQKQLNDAIEKTKNNNDLNLVLALSYSGRWEILESVKEMIRDAQNGKLQANELNVERFSSYLNTKQIPDPDLVIRTSGEFRVSNFLLWQIAYSEFYISETYWPAFKRKNLYEAIRDFQKRERRFGKVSEQIKQKETGT